MIATLLATTSLALAPFSAPALPAIEQRGANLVDATGKTVRLRGVNFGGWLVEEIWMTPWVGENGSQKVTDHASLWETVERRLGRPAMLRVRDAYRANWITPEDFRRVREAGFNHVRIPFLVEILEEPKGMQTLRDAVRLARENGLYVVLDMHGAPGGQSNEHHTGKENRNRLWFDVENITKMEQAWTKIGKEFANDSTVAVYDLMNEPMGTPNPAMLHLVYDRVIRAVRKVAPKKVVLVDDGYRGFETTPHPNLANWTNVAFSLHFYQFEAKTTQEHVDILRGKLPKLRELQGYRNAPVYIGEFNLEPHNSPESMRAFVGEMDKAGWSWALWTWKHVSPKGPMGDWGLYRQKGAFQPLDPWKDSEAELLRKMPQFRTENLTAPTEQLAAFR